MQKAIGGYAPVKQGNKTRNKTALDPEIGSSTQERVKWIPRMTNT